MATSEQVLAVAVLVLVTGCCFRLWLPRRSGPVACGWAVATVFTVLWWFFHKAPYEGPAIIEVTRSHGLTVVDMIVPPGLAAAGGVLWRSQKRRDIGHSD